MSVFRSPRTMNEARQTLGVIDPEVRIRAKRGAAALRPAWGTEVGRQDYRSWKARRAHQWRAA